MPKDPKANFFFGSSFIQLAMIFLMVFYEIKSIFKLYQRIFDETKLNKDCIYRKNKLTWLLILKNSTESTGCLKIDYAYDFLFLSQS